MKASHHRAYRLQEGDALVKVAGLFHVSSKQHGEAGGDRFKRVLVEKKTQKRKSRLKFRSESLGVHRRQF